MKNCIWLAVFVCLGSLSAGATTITQTRSIPTQGTNWDETLPFQRFDSSLGTLNSIDFSLYGSITARIGFENIRTSPSRVTSTAAATITVRDPISNVVLIQVLPGNTITDLLSGFDLNFNYAGSSGRNYGYDPSDLAFLSVGPNLGARTASATSTAAHGALASFIGTGEVLIPVSAINLTTVTGTGGSINSTFDTDAAAALTIVYNYTAAAVPEPATSALAGIALLLLGVFSRRKQV